MLREVLHLLKLSGRAKRHMEVFAKPVQEENHTLDQEGELFIGLAALQLEDTAAAVTTRADSRASVQRPPIDKSRFKVIPRETRRAAASRRKREAEALSPEEPRPSSSSPPDATPFSEAPTASPTKGPPPGAYQRGVRKGQRRNRRLRVGRLKPTFPRSARQVARGRFTTKTDSGSVGVGAWNCLLYTSPSPRDGATSRMPSSA